MKIISTTQSHNAAHLIGDALKSVLPFVDACLVCDSGITDNTLEVAKEIAGDKLIIRKFDWAGDFSSARNFHLKVASELGYDWAVTLDTDERIVGLTREHMTKTLANVLYVDSKDRAYTKQRCFRLPCKGHWAGEIHETFADPVAGQLVDKATFWEVEKTPAEKLAKAHNIIKICKKHLNSQKFLYYLGDAYAAVDDHVAAVDAFKKCADIRGWRDETSWAMYRAAECYLLLNKYEEAIRCCAQGMVLHPAIPELPWLAALASFQLGNAADAACWAMMSVPLGCYKGIGKSVTRTFFKNPFAMYEGPFDILKCVYKGNEEYKFHYQQAKDMRNENR